MLSFQGVALRRGPKLLFEGLDLQALPGQRIGLVGANGSGKSSLFAAVRGELETDAGEIRLAPGSVLGHVSQQSPRGGRSALDHVMDGDRELRDVQHRIAAAETSADGNSLHALHERMELIDGYSAEARAARLLNGLGFAEADNGRPVETFSGGWRMRLNLARALMCRSDVLLLDEPTNHLDLPAILWLESWLNRYPGVLMLVSHDRDFLDALCTRIAHIEHQSVRVYTGNYSDFESLRSARLAQQQALYRRQQDEIRHIQTYIDRFRYKASKARQAQSRVKMLERMTLIAPAHVDSPFRFHFLEPPRQPQHLAQLNDVSAGYAGPVLERVNLLVSAGDRIGLLGVNGAGKTTLVRALADGSTLLSGERTIGRDTRIGYFAQHQMDMLDPEDSPLVALRRADPDTPESEIRQYLGAFGFSGERIFEPIAPFSGGEKARLALALLIRDRPNLLLLDEPTNHLDLETRQALTRALAEFEGAIVLISHDRHLLRSACDALVVVHSGTVEEFDGDIDDYPAWLAARATGRESPGTAAPTASRKRQRQDDAARRLALKPLRDRVSAIERELQVRRSKLQDIENRLADPALYTGDGGAGDVADLGRSRSKMLDAIGQLESDWLEASEALERAEDS